jgi:hypothetical protein
MMTSTIMHNHISLALNNEDSNNQQYPIATKIHRIVLLNMVRTVITQLHGSLIPSNDHRHFRYQRRCIRTSTYSLATSDASRMLWLTNVLRREMQN